MLSDSTTCLKGCNANVQVVTQRERTGSLVKSIEVDEPLFQGRSLRLRTENREHTATQRLRGMSDDMDRKNRNGTWEALAGPERPDMPLGEIRRRALL